MNLVTKLPLQKRMRKNTKVEVCVDSWTKLNYYIKATTQFTKKITLIQMRYEFY